MTAALLEMQRDQNHSFAERVDESSFPTPKNVLDKGR